MTYTVLARCPASGRLGVAIATYSLGVGGYCPFFAPGRGVVSSQAFADPSLGTLARSLLALGYAPAKVLRELEGQDPHFAYRQVGVVDATGRADCHTGARTRPWAGHEVGDGFVAMGNVLAGPATVAAIAQAFRATAGQALDERLLRALEAGRDAGGQAAADGSHLTERSAALAIYERAEHAWLDLRVDAHERAVDELRRIHGLYAPYVPYYELRAKDPPNTPPQDEWVHRLAARQGG